MIQKSNLDNYIIHNKQFEELIRRVEDAITYVMRTNSSKVLFFINNNQANIVQDIINHYENVSYTLYSQIDNTDYEILCIHPNDLYIDCSNEIVLFHLKYNKKFTDLNHSDVLGSLMSLGLDRRMIGDIVVVDENIYFECVKSLEMYLLNNLVKIKKTTVKLDIVQYRVSKKQNYLSSKSMVKSFRLDSIISSITNLSRKDVKQIILAGDIKVNQVIVTNYSKDICDDDIVSIRKFGRYKVNFDNTKITKKGNYLLEFHKYI